MAIKNIWKWSDVMIKVLFVCHGNICRSPMAEFLFKKMVFDNNLKDMFYIDSKATSYEEEGNPIHYGTRKILDRFKIDYKNKRACRMQSSDYDYFDYIICMDSWNFRNIERITGPDKKHKVHLLLEYANIHRDISDPWYTGDFETTYQDINLGLNAFLGYLKRNGMC